RRHRCDRFDRRRSANGRRDRGTPPGCPGRRRLRRRGAAALDQRAQGDEEVGRARDAAAGPWSPRGRPTSVEVSEAKPGSPAEPSPGGLALVRNLPRARKLAVAIVSGALAVACFARFDFTGRAAVGAVFCAVLTVLTATDLEYRLIPNVIVLPATGVLLAA